MSVVIRGMKMPENCDVCPFDNGVNCMVYPPSEDMVYDIADGKPKWCPLVPVPPHGRLIDADALRQSFIESIDECHKWANEIEGGEMYARVSQSLGTFLECSLRVKSAPTIIEAEEVSE